MRLRHAWRLILPLLLLALDAPGPVAAMQFRALPLGEDRFLIEGLGTLINGDGGRLRSAIESTEARGEIVAVSLNSPGGLIQEAGRMADLIRVKNLRVVVYGGARCVSACFLVFAAGRVRLAEPDAYIGVHSASELGSQGTASSQMMTDVMARAVARYGIPPAIIAKMVDTSPQAMTWLTPDDLTSMGVLVLNGVDAENLGGLPSPPPQPNAN